VHAESRGGEREGDASRRKENEPERLGSRRQRGFPLTILAFLPLSHNLHLSSKQMFRLSFLVALALAVLLALAVSF
jgi:hypothetical protein